ncbi:MAG: hypothetical protein ACI9IQ_002775, partial [Cyclobacteriaceae bacterium]
SHEHAAQHDHVLPLIKNWNTKRGWAERPNPFF